MTDLSLSIDLWQLVVNVLQIKTAARFRQTCSSIHDKIKILKICDKTNKFEEVNSLPTWMPLYDYSIRHFPDIVRVDINDDEDVTNLNKFKNLKSVDLTNCKSVGYACIDELKLRSLKIHGAPLIHDINCFADSLKILHCSNNSAQKHFDKCINLIEIKLSNISHIKSLSGFSNLKRVYLNIQTSNCPPDFLLGLRLEKLQIEKSKYEDKIDIFGANASTLTSFTYILSCAKGVRQNPLIKDAKLDVSQMLKVKHLTLRGNINVGSLNHMSNLKILDIHYNDLFEAQDISNLCLEKLNVVSCNKFIYDDQVGKNIKKIFVKY